MVSNESFEQNYISVPLPSLRLLVPPLRLLSASMWQLAKRNDVMNYEKIQEFVFTVTEAVPGLINNTHKAQLILGLRARLILELCKDSYQGPTDPKIIEDYLKRLPICSNLTDQEADVKTVQSTFIALVKSLLKDPAERAYFFQQVFPVAYGPQYDASLHMLLWEFLSKFEDILPVPNLKQTAAWLGSAPSDIRDCLQTTHEELIKTLESYRSVGCLKVQNGAPLNIGNCILSALSIPPSQKPPLSFGLQSIHNYANIVNTETAGADMYSIVTVYTDVGASEMEKEINASADLQVQTNFVEEIMAISDSPDTKITNLKSDGNNKTGTFVNVQGTLRICPLPASASNHVPFVIDKCTTESTKNNTIGSRLELSEQISKTVRSTVCDSQKNVILQLCDKENSTVYQDGVHKQTDDSSGHPVSEKILFTPSTDVRRSVETPSRQQNCLLKTSVKDGIREQRDTFGLTSVISVNDLEGGESEEMKSIIFTCSDCPFFSSEANSPPHFHLQTAHPDVYPGLSETTFTPSPLSTDDIFTSIKLFPKGNAEQTQVETSRQDSTLLLSYLGSSSLSKNRQKDLTCKTCGKTFTRTSDVRRHQLTHTGERPFHCSQCDCSFQHSWDLAKHQSKHNGKAISFMCQICRSSFPNLRSLRVHHKNSHFEKCQLPQICSICSQSFSTSSELLEHRKCHVTNKLYACQQCGTGFDTLLARSQHRQIHQVKCQFKCLHCDKTYTRRSDVKRHMSIHTGERPYQCNQCHKRFSLHFMLIKHLRVHSGERPYQCSHCFKRFTLVSVLARHERMHTGDKPFLCSQCGKNFLSHGELSKHHRSHTDERPYPCSLCDKRFKSKKSQQEHITSHSGARPYLCSFCGKGFTKPYALTRHNLIHTGERPFPCGHCEKSFLTLSEVQLHQRIHTGERPYSCNLCALKFKSSSELSRHKRSHSALKPIKHSCEECMKTFISPVKLMKHMEMHKNDKITYSLDCKQK